MRELILLVDDDEFARGFARTVLERAGFVVHEAADVEGAITAAARLRPVVVVTDWNLPDGNGGSLARRLHEQTALLPIILVTGEGSLTDPGDEQSKPNFVAIIYKPFSPSALERAIRNVAVT